MSETRITIIGAGPAGLAAAEVISAAGHPVHIYDSNKRAGMKFYVAGRGGLNITHDESIEDFLAHYSSDRLKLEPYIRAFGPDQVKAWLAGLGFPPFTGSSGKVFPEGMKPAPLLDAWIARLTDACCIFHFEHRWTGWSDDGSLRFETPDGETTVASKAVVFALGGASWPQTGSTGEWRSLLEARGIPVAPFKPANCGFNADWSPFLREKFAGSPLKTVAASFGGHSVPGEIILTGYGLEGGPIYALSSELREVIEGEGETLLHLDLAYGRSEDDIGHRLARPRGKESTSNLLRKAIGIRGAKTALLHEILPRETFSDMRALAAAIKSLPIRVISPRPLAEAISTAGGVSFDALDENLMLIDHPGVFCAGEMLDWEAPTGGYLLTACMSTGRAAGLGALGWLRP